MVESKQIKTEDEIWLDSLEEEFWNNYPHEISWADVKEINPEIWCRCKNIGQILVLNNRLNANYLPGGSN